MLRSCVYCGKSLEKGEKCNCPQSVRARNEKNADRGAYWQNSENVYTTGYTYEENKKRKKKFSFKKPDFLKLNLLRFLKDPVGSVFSVKQLNLPAIIIANVFISIVVAFCSLVIIRIPIFGVEIFVRSAIGIFLFLCALTAVFVCIERFVLRQNTQINLFATRLLASAVPLIVFSLVGVLLSFLPGFSSILVLILGILLYLIIIYEVLRVQWRNLSASGIVYLMCAGLGVIFVILFNIIEI